MNALKDTRPFNLADAKAGAPYSYTDGEKAEIIKWNRPVEVSLVCLRGESQHVTEHYKSGAAYHLSVPDLVMTPVGYIDGRPVFVGDEYEFEGRRYCAVPDGEGGFEGCRWPEPAKRYPTFACDLDRLRAAYNSVLGSTVNGALECVANAALHHAIDSHQVVPLDQHREISEAIAGERSANRTARDMALVNATIATIKTIINGYSTDCLHYLDGKIDAAKIIAKVPA
jgi:hypothetical protein